MKRKFTKNHKEWREKVLKRDENECVICGKGPKYLNAHHLIPSSVHKWEFDVANGITLCSHCHTLGSFSAHKNPIWFVIWMNNNRPGALRTAEWRIEDVT